MTIKPYVVMFDQRLVLVHDNRHPDVRIYERTGPDSWIEYFEILRTTMLGNHYHKDKSEEFQILEGDGLLLLQHVDAHGRPIGGAITRVVKAGDKVVVEAYTAHTFVLDPGSKMTCQSSKPWDPNNQDLNQHKLA